MNFWKALFWTLIIFLSTLPIYLVFGGIQYLLNFENERLNYLMNFIPYISVILGNILLWLFVIKRRFGFMIEPIEKINLITVLATVVITLSFYIIEKPINSLFHIIFIDDNNTKPFVNWKWEDILHPATVTDTITAVLFAPIIEEILFRKFLFSELLKKYSLTFAIIISSFCFALLHLPDYKQAFGAFFLGVVAALIYYKTNNIFYPIFSHFIFNFTIDFLKFFGADIKNYFLENRFNFTYWLIVVGAVAVLYYSFTNLKITKKIEPES